MLRPARPAGLCLVSEWHVRDIFVPNPNRIHVCVPPPPVFWRAGRRGASGRWGVCAAGGRALGWGGRNFRFFNFRVRWPRNSIRGQTIMAKQTAPREAAVSPSSGRFQVVCGGGPDALVRCPTQCTLADAWPSEPTPRGAAPRRRSPPRSHRRIRLLTAARLTAAARPTRTKLRGSQRITRKRTSCPRDGPQPSSAAACEAGRAVLGLTLRSSR